MHSFNVPDFPPGSVYEESKKSVMIQPDGYQSPYTTLSYANGPGIKVLSEEFLNFFGDPNIFRPSKITPHSRSVICNLFWYSKPFMT